MTQTRETIFARNGLAPILSDHRGAPVSTANIHRRAREPRAVMDWTLRYAPEVSDDLCLVAHDASFNDAEKVIGIDSAKRDGVGSDLRESALILLLNGLFGARCIVSARPAAARYRSRQPTAGAQR
jgi:hypothetical protein